MRTRPRVRSRVRLRGHAVANGATRARRKAGGRAPPDEINSRPTLDPCACLRFRLISPDYHLIALVARFGEWNNVFFNNQMRNCDGFFFLSFRANANNITICHDFSRYMKLRFIQEGFFCNVKTSFSLMKCTNMVKLIRQKMNLARSPVTGHPVYGVCTAPSMKRCYGFFRSGS